jgi:hypothetical protein
VARTGFAFNRPRNGYIGGGVRTEFHISAVRCISCGPQRLQPVVLAGVHGPASRRRAPRCPAWWHGRGVAAQDLEGDHCVTHRSAARGNSRVRANDADDASYLIADGPGKQLSVLTRRKMLVTGGIHLPAAQAFDRHLAGRWRSQLNIDLPRDLRAPKVGCNPLRRLQQSSNTAGVVTDHRLNG